MNNKSLREKAVIAVVVVLALYAMAVVLWFVSQQDAWKRAAKVYAGAKKTYESERKLIGERQKWNDAYEEEKAQMPTFAFGKATDTTWLQKLDELAEKHHISISQRQPGKEVEKGDVLELQIEVRNWEGALESLVKFMHELENTSDNICLDLFLELVRTFLTLCKYDSCLNNLSSYGIGCCSNRTLEYIRQLHKYRLNLKRSDTVTAGLNQVIGTSNIPEISFLITVSSITCMVCTVMPYLKSLLIVTVVASKQTTGNLLISLNYDLAYFTDTSAGSVRKLDINIIHR